MNNLLGSCVAPAGTTASAPDSWSTNPRRSRYMCSRFYSRFLIHLFMARPIFKNDKYKRAREGRTRLLETFCATCSASICLYQKDGSGGLRRMYLDRMLHSHVSLLGKALVCSNGHILGMRVIYKKENRPAFRLIANAVGKKNAKPSD